MVPIEICLNGDDVTILRSNVDAAYHAGAARIELCSAMEHDGLTPSDEAVIVARQAFKRPGLLVMIRPRVGDFCYQPDEVFTMTEQIKRLAKLGVDGVVFGALQHTPERLLALDMQTLNVLIDTSKELGLEVTIHRAFDAVDDWEMALKQLILLKVDRILSSGTPWQSKLPAIQGISRLKEMLAVDADNVEWVVGGGICADKAATIASQISADKAMRRISFHAYSGVLDNDVISQKKITALMSALG